MYRYNLRQEKWIQLREEIEYTKRYLEIMQYKVENLETFYDIEDEVLEEKVIKAILQPLVENSTRHAVLNRFTMDSTLSTSSMGTAFCFV